MALVKVTKDLLTEGLSKNGGHSRAQLEAIGVKEWPPKKGWKKKIIGLHVPEENAQKFLALRDVHLQEKPQNIFKF